MECFLILCLTSCYAEAVLEVVDGFFYKIFTRIL